VLSPRDHYYPKFKEFISEIATRQIILDLGTYYAFRKELAPFADNFRKATYFTMGYRIQSIEPNERPPNLDGDVCALPLRSECADAIICKDVLEHIVSPVAAVAEMHRVLKPGGLIY
jgi:SAM-dependent methyltransferase